MNAAIAQAPHDQTDLSGPYCLPHTLDLTQARGLQENMMALLGGDEIVLDASAVERMSTPCMQVLLATGYAAGAAKLSFRLVDASDAFRGAVADLGLQTQFTNWMV